MRKLSETQKRSQRRSLAIRKQTDKQNKPVPAWAQQPGIAAPVIPHNKQVALELAAMGMLVFPCKPDKTPKDGLLWQQQASNDAATVERMFSDPAFIPAIPASLNGLLVIDCDVHTGNGIAEWEALCAANSIDLTQAVIVETASRGKHYYWRTDVEYSQAKLTANIDVRSNGYVIAPGATLLDGRSYRMLQGDGMPVPVLPAALATLLQTKRSDAPPAAPGAILGTATERDRDYFLKPFEAERAKLRALSEGRNVALMQLAKFAGNYVHFGFNRAEIEAALYADSVSNGYVAAHGSAAAWTTIRHNVADGMTGPSAMPSAQIAPEDIAQVRAQLDAAKPVAQFGQQPRSISLLWGTDIKAEAVSWLWHEFLLSDKLTLLSGQGGSGKSTIAFSLAATITTGGFWPDGTRCQQAGNVLIRSSEDDAADTIKPRLAAMQADPKRYAVIAGTKDDGGNAVPFDPARDIDLLRAAVAQMEGGVSLFIIDPIVTAVTGDMDKANDVRRSLQTIVDFAAEQHCAVIGISHFAKGTAGRNSAERVIGSQAFTAFARMTLTVEKAEGSNEGVFTRAKTNLSPDGGGFDYSIEPVQILADGKMIQTTRIAWGDAKNGSSRSIHAEVETSDKPDNTALGKAQNWLKSELYPGPRYATEIQAAAKELGITVATLRRAREAMHINISKDMDNGGKSQWSLPGAFYDVLAYTRKPEQVVGAPAWHPTAFEQVN